LRFNASYGCISRFCYRFAYLGSLLTNMTFPKTADELMQRFVVGGGDLWDLEFLVNEQGRRVAAFGKSAGVVGMALGLWTWANQVLGTSPALSPLTKPYADWDALVAEVKAVTDRCVCFLFGCLRFPSCFSTYKRLSNH
jgi:hypothetical protein